VILNGHDAWQDEVEARRDLAYVPEEPDVTPYASVREVLRLVCRLRAEPPVRADDAAAAAGLSDLGGRSVRQLSKGQRRRALLAAAWIGTPAMLVLDEPLEGLDLRIRERMLDWLTEVRSRRSLAVVASHEIEPLAALADRAIAVERGRVERFDDLPTRLEHRLKLLQRLARGGDAGIE
jgi:ABC-type multidrug transport system ATPase subunit